MNAGQNTPAPTAIDLVERPRVFSQQDLLTPEQFCTAAAERGFRLAVSHLEALHRVRALVPMYRISKSVSMLSREVRHFDVRWSHPLIQVNRSPQLSPSYRMAPSAPSMTVPFLTAGVRDELPRAQAAGRLHEPHDEPFRCWHRYERAIQGYRTFSSALYYSPYQVLQLDALRDLHWKTRRNRSDLIHPLYDWPVAPEWSNNWRQQNERNRRLAVALSSLETMYRPRVMGTILGFRRQDRLAFEAQFDPLEALKWIGWQASDVQASAEDLLWRAQSSDPLGDWVELVRSTKPAKWESLRGDARLAIDMRIAAEILLQFYEDLARAGLAVPIGPVPRFANHALRGRLGGEQSSVDRVLTEFGLSPHPSLVLVIEGETEWEIVPHVLKFLGPTQLIDRIRIINVKGIDSEINLLATYAAAPALGDAAGAGVLLVRPATCFLVVFDAEGRFKTAKQREQKRQEWIGRLARATKERYDQEVHAEDLDSLVVVESWSDEDGAFEYAHFSDEELADAILAIYCGSSLPKREPLSCEIAELRASKSNLKSAWRDWSGPRPGKKTLGQTLWPVLEHKLKTAQSRAELEQIPIARVMIKALQLAANVHRSDVMIRLAPTLAVGDAQFNTAAGENAARGN